MYRSVVRRGTSDTVETGEVPSAQCHTFRSFSDLLAREAGTRSQETRECCSGCTGSRDIRFTLKNRPLSVNLIHCFKAKTLLTADRPRMEDGVLGDMECLSRRVLEMNM